MKMRIIIKQTQNIRKNNQKKGDKSYVKWKGYDNSFNNWINKKDVVA